RRDVPGGPRRRGRHPRREPRGRGPLWRGGVGATPATAADAWVGAVLCGGASRRMGRDKALLVIGGRPLARRVAGSLRAAGAAAVVAIGGDEGGLRAAGLEVVPDDRPGEGPLGGLVTALRWAARRQPPAAAVVVLACDLVDPAPHAVRRTLDALAADPGGDVAVPVVGSRHQWAHAAWRLRAGKPLAVQFGRGERAMHAA